MHPGGPFGVRPSHREPGLVPGFFVRDSVVTRAAPTYTGPSMRARVRIIQSDSMEHRMRRLVLALVSLTGAALAHAQTAESCASLAAPRALPGQPTVVAPLAPGLAAPSHQLGAPTGVLANAFDESRSVDQVLFRLQVDQCRNVASVTAPVSPDAPLPAAVPGMPAAAPGTAPSAPDATSATTAPSATDPAAYQPKTEFDNTPWRFDMNQNGKRMTADEFSAWMKSKGVRVARGASKPAATAAVDPAAPAIDGEAPVAAPGASAPVPAEAPVQEDAEATAEGDQ